MATSCDICHTYKTARRYISINKSKYKDELVKQVVKRDPAPRGRNEKGPMACNLCFERVIRAVKTDSKVVMLPSKLGRHAGLGVRARKPLLPGEFVTRYGGILVKRGDDVAALPTISHVSHYNATHVIDGRANYKAIGLGSIVNRAPVKKDINVRFGKALASRSNPIDIFGVKVPPVSKKGRRIEPGEELLTTYGKGYKMPDPPETPKNNFKRGRPRKKFQPSQLNPSYKRLVNKDRAVVRQKARLMRGKK